MNNIIVDGGNFTELFDALGELAGTSMVVVGVILLTACLLVLAAYVITSLGLSKQAKHQGIDHAYLAWIPYARNYLLGEMADIYGKTDYLKWVLLGLPFVTIFVSVAGSVVTLATLGFTVYAYYLIFKNIKPNSYIVYTIFSAFGLGPIFLLFIKDENKASNNNIKKDYTEAKIEEKHEEVSEKHCPKCGEVIENDAQYCGNCGSKIK